jgi:hypothetical protein
MAIHLKGDQYILGFRIDGVLFFDQELLRLWVHADHPQERHFFIDLGPDTHRTEVQANGTDTVKHTN